MAQRLRKHKAFLFGLGIVITIALTTVIQEERPPEPVVHATPAAVVAEAEQQAAPASRAAPPAPPAPKARAVPVAGTQVQVDPTTGKLLPPTPAQRKSLAQALRTQFRADPYGPYYFADGTISFIVGAERFNFSLVQLDKDGLPEMHCVSGLEQAVELLEGELPRTLHHELRAEE